MPKRKSEIPPKRRSFALAIVIRLTIIAAVGVVSRLRLACDCLLLPYPLSPREVQKSRA